MARRSIILWQWYDVTLSLIKGQTYLKTWRQFVFYSNKSSKKTFLNWHNVIVNNFSRLVMGYWRQVTEFHWLKIWQVETPHCQYNTTILLPLSKGYSEVNMFTNAKKKEIRRKSLNWVQSRYKTKSLNYARIITLSLWRSKLNQILPIYRMGSAPA